jgi:hypothetical protein
MAGGEIEGDDIAGECTARKDVAVGEIGMRYFMGRGRRESSPGWRHSVDRILVNETAAVETLPKDILARMTVATEISGWRQESFWP